jgi:uncharacterized protein involved in outer membrane biogenesis
MSPDPKSDANTGWRNAQRALASGVMWARTRVSEAVWSWNAFLRWSAAALVAMLAIGIVWLYFLDWNTLRGPVARYASHRLNREVHIAGNLDVHLFSLTPRVSASGVKITNPAWVGQPLAADIGKLAFSFRLIPLIFGTLILPSVEIDDPNILIVRDAQGRTNWDIGLSNDGAKLPAIRRFTVQNGHLNIDDHLRKMVFEGTVSSHERANGGDAAFQLTGEGKLNGNKFLADVHGGPLLNVDVSKPYRFTVDIHSGATHVTADGNFPHPFHLGYFSAQAIFSGPTLSDLYYLIGIPLPGTKPYRLSASVTRDGSLYRFSNLTGVVGSTDLHGNLSVQAADNPTFVQATLTSRQLTFTDLGPMFGALPAGDAKSVSVLPATILHVERLRQLNADIQYDAKTVKSQDFPLREAHVHAVVKNGVFTLNPIAINFSHGKLTGSIQIDAHTDSPETDVDARLTDLRLEQFFSGNPPPLEGLLEARAKLHGTGNSVHKVGSTANGAITLVIPSGKFREAFAELTGINLLNGLGLLLTNDKSDTGLRCGLMHFDARGGVLHAQQFVLDTDPVLIQGKGSVDLSRETVDLSITGQPKEFRIGRVRAPITLTGSLSSPTVGVNAAAALGQGGIAAALSFLSPVAALLPFVDPGLAKNADCVTLTQEAKKGAAAVKTRHMTTPSGRKTKQ